MIPIPDDDKVSGKLRSMVDAMIVAVPSLDRQTATHFLLHSAHGRKLAEHFNNLSKGEPMPQVDVFKLANIESVREIAKHIMEKDDISEFDFTKILMGHAHLAKREGKRWSGVRTNSHCAGKRRVAAGLSGHEGHGVARTYQHRSR
jgi:hypothetical protein